MLRKISFWYTLAFIIFWNGYTIHQYITGQPNVLELFVFGISFTVILLATTWFSRWLMSHYKVVDEKAEEILSAKFKNKRSERNGRTVH